MPSRIVILPRRCDLPDTKTIPPRAEIVSPERSVTFGEPAGLEIPEGTRITSESLEFRALSFAPRRAACSLARTNTASAPRVGFDRQRPRSMSSWHGGIRLPGVRTYPHENLLASNWPRRRTRFFTYPWASARVRVLTA